MKADLYSGIPQMIYLFGSPHCTLNKCWRKVSIFFPSCLQNVQFLTETNENADAVIFQIEFVPAEAEAEAEAPHTKAEYSMLMETKVFT